MMKKKITFFLLICTMLISSVFIMGCDPVVSPYPFRPASEIKAQAQQLSDSLLAYITDWMAGRVGADIPESVLPPGIYVDNEGNPNTTLDFQLEAYNASQPNTYWCVRSAQKINQNALMNGNPDPHYTYVIKPILGPLESKVIMKGKFPKSRYFLVTPTLPLNGLQYRSAFAGPVENPIIDVDIDPDAGSVNPFRLGANRNATSRNYTLTFINKIADAASAPAQYCPKPPTYRGVGNTRYIGSILYSGPGFYGPPDSYPNGLWYCGDLWMRYALPDGYKNATFDPLAGVGLPTVYQELADGRKFNIKNANHSAYVSSLIQTYTAITNNMEPEADFQNFGFRKMFGILHALAYGAILMLGKDTQWVHDFVRGVEGRGYDIPAPGNWEGSATCVPQCNYFCKYPKLGNGKCITLIGKLPTFPSTVNGESTMTSGQMRYWSITAAENANNDRGGGITTSSIADFEIKIDANRRYIICFSKEADRPVNATEANGVTWVNWGPNSDTQWTWRWVSISSDWYFDKTPDETRLTWLNTGYDSPQYNNSLIGNNTHTGWMGEYQPVSNYMSKSCFENLGSPVTWDKVKGVSYNCTTAGGGGGGGCGINVANTSNSLPLIILPLLVSLCAIGVWRRKMQAD
jgi:hypothetical protein